MKDPFEGVGLALRAIRRRRGWTQRTWASRCGLDSAAISKYESGFTRPSLESLGQLLASADCSLKDFDDILHLVRGEPIEEHQPSAAEEAPKGKPPMSDDDILQAVMRALADRLPS